MSALLDTSDVCDGAPAAPRERARDAKRKAILDIARESFLTEGYAGTSMSAIAARLGGSKGTLYNYFPSKEELFQAVMRDECSSEAVAMTSLSQEGEIGEVLRRLGRNFVRFVLSERAVGMHRIVAAESARFPELGRVFYAEGPGRSIANAAAFLSQRMDECRLRPADPQRAAQHLFALLKSSRHQQHLWGVAEPMGEAELESHVSAAVETFLHGYAVEA